MPAIECTGLLLENLGQEPQLAPIRVEEPGPGEVRVRLIAAGICHTDAAATRDAKVTPVVLGHEGAGVIEMLGQGTHAPPVGTPVVLSWKTPCGECRGCRAGRSWLCTSVLATAEPRVFWQDKPAAVMLNTGCLAEYCVVPAASVIEVGSGIDWPHRAILGCAVATGLGAALFTAPVRPGEYVGVWGAGGVGLNVVAGCQLALAAVIVAVDPDPSRRHLATVRGATHVAAPDDAARVVADATQGQGLDHAFEVTGLESVAANCLNNLSVGGQLVLVGAPSRTADLTFRPRMLLSNQQRITGCIYGSIRPHIHLPQFAEWYRQGVLPLDDLVTKPISLEEAVAAIGSPVSSPIRQVVRFD